jgi:hypothetical protein
MKFFDKREFFLHKYFKSANKDRFALESLLIDLYGVTFDNGVCSNKSVKIAERTNKTGFIVTDFGGIADINETKDFEGILYTLFKGNFAEQKRLLEKCLGVTIPTNNDSHQNENTNGRTKKTHPPVTIPTTTTETIKKPLEFIFGAWNSLCGIATEQYFLNKTGANLAYLQAYNVQPISTKKQGTYTFHYETENFGFAVVVGLHQKGKFPNTPKALYFWV